MNLTNAQLSKSEVEVLEKGLSFAPAPNKLLTTHLIAAAEKGLSKLQSNVASDARKRIASLLSRSKPPPSNLTPEQKRAIKSLGARDDILILPADKGRATVVMARDDYLNKMNAMLSDDKMYQPVEKDPTPPLERKMNALLLQLKKKGSIAQNLYNLLRSTGGSTPLLYGLPKIHKPDAEEVGHCMLPYIRDQILELA